VGRDDRVNLTGVWKSAKAVAPHMIERGSGSIVITLRALRRGQAGAIAMMKNIALSWLHIWHPVHHSG
jgi:NADP-dependent 3-hydroxy acid dehydrogenase YdfG